MTPFESGLIYAIPVQEGFVVEPPVWEDWHPAARNWLARIEENPQRPKGIARKWCERGKGRFRYAIENIREGNTIEFGADKMLRNDERRRTRWYGEVVGFTDDAMLVRYFATLEEMFITIHDRESRLQEASE